MLSLGIGRRVISKIILPSSVIPLKSIVLGKAGEAFELLVEYVFRPPKFCRPLLAELLHSCCLSHTIQEMSRYWVPASNKSPLVVISSSPLLYSFDVELQMIMEALDGD